MKKTIIWIFSLIFVSLIPNVLSNSWNTGCNGQLQFFLTENKNISRTDGDDVYYLSLDSQFNTTADTNLFITDNQSGGAEYPSALVNASINDGNKPALLFHPNNTISQNKTYWIQYNCTGVAKSYTNEVNISAISGTTVQANFSTAFNNGGGYSIRIGNGTQSAAAVQPFGIASMDDPAANFFGNTNTHPNAQQHGMNPSTAAIKWFTTSATARLTERDNPLRHVVNLTPDNIANNDPAMMTVYLYKRFLQIEIKVPSNAPPSGTSLFQYVSAPGSLQDFNAIRMGQDGVNSTVTNACRNTDANFYLNNSFAATYPAGVVLKKDTGTYSLFIVGNLTGWSVVNGRCQSGGGAEMFGLQQDVAAGREMMGRGNNTWSFWFLLDLDSLQFTRAIEWRNRILSDSYSFSGFLPPLITTDITPPSITYYNLTNENGCESWTTDKNTTCSTSSVTPTVQFNTNENAWCAIAGNSSPSLLDKNYTDMGSSRNCTGSMAGEGGTTNHRCTLTPQDELVYDTSYLFLSCKDANGNQNRTSTSSSLKVSVTGLETARRNSIGIGIQNALLSGYTNYTDLQIYTRNLSNAQVRGTFDRAAKKGSKMWAFNGIGVSDSYVNMFNLTPVLYNLEFANVTSARITNLTELMINATK